MWHKLASQTGRKKRNVAQIALPDREKGGECGTNSPSQTGRKRRNVAQIALPDKEKGGECGTN